MEEKLMIAGLVTGQMISHPSLTVRSQARSAVLTTPVASPASPNRALDRRISANEPAR
jgi:hypothetical protein